MRIFSSLILAYNQILYSHNWFVMVLLVFIISHKQDQDVYETIADVPEIEPEVKNGKEVIPGVIYLSRWEYEVL